MTYLNDPTIDLTKSSCDETGAVRYNCRATAPDNCVVDFQTDLSSLGFIVGEIDGAFGNMTSLALKNFQTQSSMTVRFNGRTLTEVPVPDFQFPLDLTVSSVMN